MSSSKLTELQSGFSVIRTCGAILSQPLPKTAPILQHSAGGCVWVSRGTPGDGDPLHSHGNGLVPWGRLGFHMLCLRDPFGQGEMPSGPLSPPERARLPQPLPCPQTCSSPALVSFFPRASGCTQHPAVASPVPNSWNEPSYDLLAMPVLVQLETELVLMAARTWCWQLLSFLSPCPGLQSCSPAPFACAVVSHPAGRLRRPSC